MIPIKTTKAGYTIAYDESKKDFVAKDKGHEVVFRAPTQQEVEEFLKKLEKRHFKRIKAIRFKYNSVDIGEVTSVSREYSSYRGYYFDLWFVTRNEQGKSERGKYNILNFYQATEENLKIAGQIQKLETEMKRAEEIIKRLSKEFKTPITEENVLKLAGVESE